jgi:hypothetical protein
MAYGRSVFPEQLDSFLELLDLNADQRINADRYKVLKLKTSLNEAEQTELNGLMVTLQNYILTPEIWNKTNDCLVGMETFITTTWKNYYKYIGDYSGSTAYKAYNSVRYTDGNIYMALQDVTGVLPTDNTKWLKLSSKGDRGLTQKGLYSGVTTYIKDDVVNYDGSAYICILNSTGNLPTNTTYWNLLISKGDAGVGLVYRGEYSASTAYVLNDLVTRYGSTYYCKQGNTGVLPEGDTTQTYWNVYIAGGGENLGDLQTTNKTSLVGAVNEIHGEATTHENKFSSTSVIGHIQLATNAEVTTGTDTTRAVTPSGVKVELDKKVNHSLATATNDFLVGNIGGGSWVKKTLAEIKTILGLGTAAYTASTAYATAAHENDTSKHVNATNCSEGTNANAEGDNTIASGVTSHAEGINNLATGYYSHAEGSANNAYGTASHAEGLNNFAEDYTHAEGKFNLGIYGTVINITAVSGQTITVASTTGLAINDYIYIKIDNNVAIEAQITNIVGSVLTVSGGTPNSNWKKVIKANGNSTIHVEGMSNLASGFVCHAEGYYTTASGDYSHAEGSYTTASAINSHVMGQYNKALTGSASTFATTNHAFVIGNGTSAGALSNAFRVNFNGAAYGLSAYNSTGADYAEMFEWKDQNPENEDRVGYFVTIDGDKIRKANSTDDYILGVVSASPSVIGNNSADQWIGQYLKDEFDRPLVDETGNYILNPEWDTTKEYIAREARPEWDAIGLVGRLLVRDDGTCIVNGYCKSNDNGIATNGDSGYRVMKRVSENIVQVLIK